MILEYKSDVARLKKEKETEVGKVMIEKIRLEDDLRNATTEKKRLADTERMLLNTFDTLKKYYDTKDKNDNSSSRTSAENNSTDEEEEISKCRKCRFETKSKDTLNRHIADEHDIDIRNNMRKTSTNSKTSSSNKQYQPDGRGAR